MFIDWITVFSNFTVKDFGNLIIGSVFTGGAFWLCLQYVAKKIIDYKVTQEINAHQAKLNEQLAEHKKILDQQLEERKQELQVLTEDAKTEFSRQLQNFSIYNTKRHETYALLYALFLQSFQEISSLNIKLAANNFSQYSSKKLEKLLQDIGAEQSIIDRYVTNWENQKQNWEVLETLSKDVKSIKIELAHNKLQKTKNEFLKLLFYISKQVEDEMWQVYLNLQALIDNRYYDPSIVEDQEFIKIRESAENNLRGLKEKLKEELSRGDYKLQ